MNLTFKVPGIEISATLGVWMIIIGALGMISMSIYYLAIILYNIALRLL